MAYYLNVTHPTVTHGLLKFDKGNRQYVTISFIGFASSAPYDILKVETSPDASTFTTLDTFTLTAASGVLKTVLPPIPAGTLHLRLKGYDSDGSTALTDATELKKCAVVNIKSKASHNLEPIYTESKKIAEDVIDSGIVTTDIENLNQKKIMWNALSNAYAEINTNDATDMTEYTITGVNNNLYGLAQYPSWLKTQITDNKNWVINGSNLTTPHWIIGDKIYSFKETGSDGGVAIAQSCEEVLVSHISKSMLAEEKLKYTAGSDEHDELTAAETTLSSIITDKITLI
jgi:hypothetical protein